MMNTRGYLNQKGAAHYLGVTPRYFRDHVHVVPVPLPGGGGRSALRYRVADLDAWMDALRNPKARRTAGRAA